MTKPKQYTAKYEDKEYSFSLANWEKFLKDKPVEHLSQSSMRGRITRGNRPIEQCLGIEELVITHKCGRNRNQTPMVNKNELELYYLVNSYLRKGL